MRRLIIDTETTGLSPRFNKVLTVGLLLIDAKKSHLQILDQNHIFIKHEKYNATKAAMRVNKIDLERHNLHAIPPTDACNQINSFIEKNVLHQAPLVGHNIHFDKGFLSVLFKKTEILPKLCHESEDTMRIWRNHQKLGNVPSHFRATLGTLADYFKINYTKSHDALADCHITAKVYHKMLKI